jgi:hypothetical protein
MISFKTLLSALLSSTHLDEILDAMDPQEPTPHEPEIEYNNIPELNGKMLRFEAKKLGLKLSDFTEDELRKKVISEFFGSARQQ